MQEYENALGGKVQGDYRFKVRWMKHGALSFVHQTFGAYHS